MSDRLKTDLERHLAQSRKARDRLRTTVLSSTLAEIRNREIADGAPADDETIQQVLARALKQRREAAEQMRAGGREELAAREDREAEILGEFLPPPLADDEVRRMVRELVDEGIDQPGPLMGRLMPQIRGRFDGKDANRIVREELAP